MKKIFLLLFASMQIGTTLLAQNGFYWTVGAAVGKTQTRGTYGLNSNNATLNSQIGIGYAHTWRKKVGIGVDVLYTTAWYRSRYDNGYVPNRMESNAWRSDNRTIHIQPYLSYKINDKWYVKGGLSAGFSLYGNHSHGDLKNNLLDVGVTVAAYRSFKNFDIGLKYEHYVTPYRTVNNGSNVGKMFSRQLGLSLMQRF